MRVALNLLPVRPDIGGTWNYIANLLEALSIYAPTTEFHCLATDASREIVPRTSNFTMVDVQLDPSSVARRILYESTLLSRALRRLNPDCVHHVFGTLPLNASGPSVVSVYDLIEFERPNDFPFVKRKYLRFMRRRTAARATIIAPMSHTTQRMLESLLRVAPERIHVIPPALPPSFIRQSSEAIAAFRREYNLPEQFWLTIAAPIRRKNFETLFASLVESRRRARSAIPLVLRSEPTDYLRTLAANAGVSDEVIFLPRLPAAQMPLLYSASFALVFPSHMEGGGLPVLEAMACGCPVIASNIPTTAEFAGSAALTFEPNSHTSLADALCQFRDDAAGRITRVASGLRAADLLHPRHVAKQCLAAYERAVSWGFTT